MKAAEKTKKEAVTKEAASKACEKVRNGKETKSKRKGPDKEKHTECTN